MLKLSPVQFNTEGLLTQVWEHANLRLLMAEEGAYDPRTGQKGPKWGEFSKFGNFCCFGFEFLWSSTAEELWSRLSSPNFSTLGSKIQIVKYMSSFSLFLFIEEPMK
ncbi:hypothetical protein Y032_0084g1729 [Ancylostoma ceylanicum]|uniref:Uncharacterized protein n=1 Tax=Ancylostoma ceylanicum TaxID=53326 RepID=A0A016TRI4_9BILA|nr:hypothetical protein Y032_0084g1729 [Ancylostoma ceylanicum]